MLLKQLAEDWKNKHRELCEPPHGYATCADELSAYAEREIELIAALANIHHKYRWAGRIAGDVLAKYGFL